jgi:hypothetical protein
MEQKEHAKNRLKGNGHYKFLNRSKAEFILPKPGLKGEKRVDAGKTFEGDDYFFAFVPSILIQVESFNKEKPVEPEVLLMEQPPVYTTDGQVEYVKDTGGEELIEESEKSKAKKNPKKKLLVEDTSAS